VTDLSLAERGFLRLSRQIRNVRARPAAVLAVGVSLGAVIAMASALANASAFPGATFTVWLSLASAAFGLRVELALVVATFLLVLDSASGASYRGQRLLFGVMVAVGGLGIGTDLVAMTVVLVQGGAPPVGAARLVAWWAVIVCSDLAPVSLAALTCWLGRHGARSVGTPEEAWG
jgi:hypothetical protein